MTSREIWRSIMSYGSFDRMPVGHWGGWPETRERWIKEGLRTDISESEYLGVTQHWGFVGVNVNLYPAFAEEILEETEEYKIFRANDGVIQQAWKKKAGIPHFIDFTLKDASQWPEYKKRLQPDPGRIPPDLDARIARAEASGLWLAIETGSLMGWIRNWMGLENMAYLMYDAPDVYADMVDTIARLSCWAIDQVVPKMKNPPDMGFGWEDICGRSGPLVSPDIMRRHVAPGYAMIRRKLDAYGTHLLGIDCDGDVAQLVKPWLDSGVNVFFPIEIGVWNADPMAYRKQYGREMRIIGGINKMVLEKGPVEIEAEIERRIPIMQDGGFIPMPDHLITPGASLANYQYYLQRMKQLRF